MRSLQETAGCVTGLGNRWQGGPIRRGIVHLGPFKNQPLSTSRTPSEGKGSGPSFGSAGCQLKDYANRGSILLGANHHLATPSGKTSHRNIRRALLSRDVAATYETVPVLWAAAPPRFPHPSFDVIGEALCTKGLLRMVLVIPERVAKHVVITLEAQLFSKLSVLIFQFPSRLLQVAESV